MRISEVIKQLKEIKKVHGDLDVLGSIDYEGFGSATEIRHIKMFNQGPDVLMLMDTDSIVSIVEDSVEVFTTCGN